MMLFQLISNSKKQNQTILLNPLKTLTSKHQSVKTTTQLTLHSVKKFLPIVHHQTSQ